MDVALEKKAKSSNKKLEKKFNFASDKYHIIDLKVTPQSLYTETNIKKEEILNESRNQQSHADALLLSSRRIGKLVFAYAIGIASVYLFSLTILPIFVSIWLIVTPLLFWITFLTIIIINRTQSLKIKTGLSKTFVKTQELNAIKINIEKNFDKINAIIYDKKLIPPNSTEVSKYKTKSLRLNVFNAEWDQSDVEFDKDTLLIKGEKTSFKVRLNDINEITIKVGLNHVDVDIINSNSNLSLRVSKDLIRFLYRLKKFLS